MVLERVGGMPHVVRRSRTVLYALLVKCNLNTPPLRSSHRLTLVCAYGHSYRYATRHVFLHVYMLFLSVDPHIGDVCRVLNSCYVQCTRQDCSQLEVRHPTAQDCTCCDRKGIVHLV